VNRELVDAGFVRETADGEYDYALEQHARDALGDHFSDDEIAAVVDELEERVDNAITKVIES
jgi:uncharacterized protein YwgA